MTDADDVILDSPNSGMGEALAARGFQRINDPRNPPSRDVDSDTPTDAELFDRALRALHNLHGRQCVCVFCERLAAQSPPLLPVARDEDEITDTQRLDWIEETCHGTGHTVMMGGVCYWAVDMQCAGPRSKITRLGSGDNLREAIDDAILASRSVSPEGSDHD